MGCGQGKAPAETQLPSTTPASLTEEAAMPTLLDSRTSTTAKSILAGKREISHLFHLCDKDHNGLLTWSDGEICNFIAVVFGQHGLPSPAEAEMYELYQKYDADQSGSLDAMECIKLVNALFGAFDGSPTTLPPFQVHHSVLETPRIDAAGKLGGRASLMDTRGMDVGLLTTTRELRACRAAGDTFAPMDGTISEEPPYYDDA